MRHRQPLPDATAIARLLGTTDEDQHGEEYRRLVAELTADWLADNFTLDNRVPDEVRKRIEDHCHRQLQHARRLRSQH